MSDTDFPRLAAFLAVARYRNFRKASEHLGISRPAVSQSLSSLETELGVRLFNRTTRSVALTEAGQALEQRLSPALADISCALADTRELHTHLPSGTVRLSVSRIAATLFIGPALARFHARYPAIRLEVNVEDALRDVVENQFDAGIRLGEKLQKDMIAVRIGPEIRAAVVGSPAYFATRGKPAHPKDLSGHSCIQFRYSGSGKLYDWEFEKDGKPLKVMVDGPVTVNDPTLMLEAALDGVGLAYALEPTVLRHIEEGRLIRVLAECCPPFPGFYLYHPSRKHVPSALRAFIDFLAAEFR